MPYTPNDSVQRRVKAAMALFDGKDGCWEWPKSRTAGGYGQLSTSNGSAAKVELHYAHRASYFIDNGPIPDGMFICHHCDNPPCFNPAHLFLGTPKDNSDDCIRKGRQGDIRGKQAGDKHWTRRKPDLKDKLLCGERHHATRLTAADVLHIRASPEKGVRLAERFGITASAISAIRHRKTFKSI